MITSTAVTVFFNDGFWKALVERRADGLLSFATHLFGAEPSDAEAYNWWLSSSVRLEFSRPVPCAGGAADRSKSRKKKVRRAAREIVRAPITEEIRANAHAERKRRRLAEKAAGKRQRIVFEQMKRQKAEEKARKKKRGR